MTQTATSSSSPSTSSSSPTNFPGGSGTLVRVEKELQEQNAAIIPDNGNFASYITNDKTPLYQKLETSSDKPLPSPEDYERDLTLLHRLQWIPCLFFIGGFGRISATTLNFFEGEEAFYEVEWIVLIPLLTSVAVMFDILYYAQMAQKDKWRLDTKYGEYKEALSNSQPSTPQEGEVSSSSISEIFQRTKESVRDQLTKADKNSEENIIKVLNNDIFIQQLLIQSGIDRDALIGSYQKAIKEYDAAIAAGKTVSPPNIIALIEQASWDLTRDVYDKTHPVRTQLTEFIEKYLQSFKEPARAISVLLLARMLSPNHDFGLGLGEDFTWSLIIAVAFSVWVTSIIATHYAFKREKTIEQYDLAIRKIKSTHHDALLATLLLGLADKSKDPNNIIKSTKTPPKETWRFSNFIWIKLLPSLFCLGYLGRRPFTLDTFIRLSDEEIENIDQPKNETDELTEDKEIVLSFVALAMLIDLIYMTFSLIQEKWKLDRKENELFILGECYSVETERKNELEGIKSNIGQDDEKKLIDFLNKHQAPPIKKLYEDENKGWAFIGAIYELLSPTKFLIRGMSLGITLPGTMGITDSLDCGDVEGFYMGMIIGASIGFLMGLLIYQTNIIREKKLGKTNKTIRELFHSWRPDGKSPDGKSPDGKSPDGKSPDGKSPDEKNLDEKSPDEKSDLDKKSKQNTNDSNDKKKKYTTEHALFFFKPPIPSSFERSPTLAPIKVS